ncbi:2-polyprenyl-3-methyl-5-hydroxy-6-metoxy-1,4-benzoquinol methylase [Kitasatospora sp. MAP12-15]|uniref:class I SAM-dependent methyltransferase n=1 Tax=unclassified Kitasatospora TaxID=2633591 RepID=UPI00247464A7|nr:class I SAM-dependent methyltransferase [Kitasatospora sp. MAP12-44]MDH6114091.1 2-polyprenyl-3-methyl-5-hydroxy-6-metoxy-1,4-benzoquinol methylase [Kitasatospora sp. MAP12-44]
MAMQMENLDQDKVMEFLMRVVADGGAAAAGLCTSLGDRLGLYTAMAGSGSMSSMELAEKTGLHERYVREWLAAQVAGEYVMYDPEKDAYLLPDEHAAVLADPSMPTYAAGFFTMMQALYGTEDVLMEAFRTGSGVGWEEHSNALFAGTAKFFRPGYSGSLVPEWIPAMNGTEGKLRKGAEVADIGCGYGWSTLLMAEAYPASTFHGFDFHQPSVEAARRNAEQQGMADRVSFEVASAQDFPGEGYDLITFFDCLHDMGDPGSALEHAREALAADGSCMIVEPNVSADVRENANPIGRAVVSASVAVCLPSALAQHGPQAMGNHAGEGAMRRIADEAGLHHWKLAAESPVNRVYAASR